MNDAVPVLNFVLIQNRRESKFIKYRWWDGKKMSYFVPGCFIIHDFEGPIIQMLATGLKQKNGKEIYEGDILKIPFVVQDSILIIKFGTYHIDDKVGLHGIGFFKECPRGYFKGALCYDDVHGRPREVEVIGNIYENPEMGGRVEE